MYKIFDEEKRLEGDKKYVFQKVCITVRWCDTDLLNFPLCLFQVSLSQIC